MEGNLVVTAHYFCDRRAGNRNEPSLGLGQNKAAPDDARRLLRCSVFLGFAIIDFISVSVLLKFRMDCIFRRRPLSDYEMFSARVEAGISRTA
jgi:hypothetical protein